MGALDLSIRKGTETLAEWLYIPGHKEASDESSIADFEIAKDGKLRLIVAKKTRSAGRAYRGASLSEGTSGMRSQAFHAQC